jgi:hypothetical protein
VPDPLLLTKKAASFLKDSGYLYIEVPQQETLNLQEWPPASSAET